MITRRAPCPQCDRGSSDRALAITSDERGTVSYCHRCGYVETDNTRQPGIEIELQPVPNPDRLRAIWDRTLPLVGTIGERYLWHRHCRPPPADSDLRFLAGNDRFPPSLCGLITDAITNEPISLHFTRLAPDGRGKAGTDRDRLLLKGHRKAGGVIRLWPDEAVTDGLAIAEGIETALCAARCRAPIWACVDAGNLSKFPVLAGIESLMVFADHDDAGLKAAGAVARRWHDAGREVRVLRPVTPGHDVADEYAA